MLHFCRAPTSSRGKNMLQRKVKSQSNIFSIILLWGPRWNSGSIAWELCRLGRDTLSSPNCVLLSLAWHSNRLLQELNELVPSKCLA